jgi:hypothetical protein
MRERLEMKHQNSAVKKSTTTETEVRIIKPNRHLQNRPGKGTGDISRKCSKWIFGLISNEDTRFKLIQRKECYLMLNQGTNYSTESADGMFRVLVLMGVLQRIGKRGSGIYQLDEKYYSTHLQLFQDYKFFDRCISAYYDNIYKLHAFFNNELHRGTMQDPVKTLQKTIKIKIK